MEFENKPVKDWTLAEAKEYCEKHSLGQEFCMGLNCLLNDSESCIGDFRYMELNDIPKFTQDEITFCQLCKKTFPWVRYVSLDELGRIQLTEECPVLEDGELWVSPSSRGKNVPTDFLPSVKPFIAYSIDDIIALDDAKS